MLAPFVKVGLKEPLVGKFASVKVSLSLLLTDRASPDLLGDTFIYVRCGQETLSLSSIGLIIPSLEMGMRERASRCWQGEGLGESKAVYTVLQIRVSG